MNFLGNGRGLNLDNLKLVCLVGAKSFGIERSHFEVLI